MGKTSIEWTTFSSNPLRYRDENGRTVWACTKISPGCAHCYSEALGTRFRRGGPFTKAVTAKVTPYLDVKELHYLLASRKLSGKMVFVCDMTDLFGEWVSDEMIAALFGVFAARPDVVFQILTKRAERMSRWFEWVARDIGVINEGAREVLGRDDVAVVPTQRHGMVPGGWPLPNVWIGVSVEDQQRTDERYEHLLRVPAAVRWYSAEPLLGPIERLPLDSISWCVVGGESGPCARPMAMEWARSLSEQCAASGVPYFFKQAGREPTVRGLRVPIADRKGGDLASLLDALVIAGVEQHEEWKAVLRREFPR